VTDASPAQARGPRTSFRVYLTGLSADLVGDQVWFLAVAWAATEIGGPGSAGMIIAVAGIPRLLLLLPAGVLVDRVGALPVGQMAQVIRIAVMVAALGLAALDALELVPLLCLAVLFGVGDAVRLPAASSLPPSLLPAEELVRGQGSVVTAGRAASIVAGPVSGVVLAVGGFGAAVAANLCLCLIGYLTFRSLRRHVGASPAGTSNKGVRGGFAYLRNRKDILMLLSLVAGLNIALIGPLNLGVVLRVREESWGPAALGLIIGAFGAAASAGALLLALTRAARPSPERGMIMLALGGAGIVALGLAPNVIIGVLAAAAVGLALGPAGAMLVGMVQGATDRAYIGRVMGAMSVASYGLAPLALAGFGGVAARLGVSPAFVVSGVLVGGLAILGLISPSVREISRPTLAEAVSGPFPERAA